MYNQFYGLRQKPFMVTPDPEFLYMSPVHQRAIDLMTYGIQQGLGFLVLTGEAGSGKTTVIRALLQELEGRYKTAYILNPVLSTAELLRSILDDLGLEVHSTSKVDLLWALNQFLLAQHAAGSDVLVVIDESQNLSRELLEELRMLSNLETGKSKLLTLLLAGQPELDTILDDPRLRQLKQRIALRVKLSSLTRGETAVYIHHRLSVAGADGLVRFTSEAVEMIFEQSRGIPRIINQLCNAALLAGYVAGQRVITKKTLRMGTRELFNNGPVQRGWLRKGRVEELRSSHRRLGVVFFVCLIVLAYLIL